MFNQVFLKLNNYEQMAAGQCAEEEERMDRMWRPVAGRWAITCRGLDEDGRDRKPARLANG
jgi:hypothetical protein